MFNKVVNASASLAELQMQLQEYLLDKTNIPAGITTETERFKQEDRLNIYYQAYRLRLIEALGKDFPALEKYLGAEKFSEICLAYIAAHPSNDPSLRWLSQYFVAFLTQRKEPQDLIDLARFEWAQVMAFDATEANTIEESALKSLAPEAWMGIQLKFHPSLQKIQLFTPASQRWQQLELGKEEADSKLLSNNSPLTWIIWRKNLQILFQSCDQLELEALNCFLEGENLHSVFENLSKSATANDLQQLPLQIASFLQRWIKQGWIVALH